MMRPWPAFLNPFVQQKGLERTHSVFLHYILNDVSLQIVFNSWIVLPRSFN